MKGGKEIEVEGGKTGRGEIMKDKRLMGGRCKKREGKGMSERSKEERHRGKRREERQGEGM